MRAKFFIPFYLLSAIGVFLYSAACPTAAEPGMVNLGRGQFQVGDFDQVGPAPIPAAYPVPQVDHTFPLPFRASYDPLTDDLETDGAMQLLWDGWHKRVAESVYTSFNRSAQMLFKHGPPLACQVSYMVARDGRVGNVRILQPSTNPVFNTMLLTVIHSIAGNPVLEFPQGSKRQFVEKTGTFTWNCSGGQSFKGDFGRELPPCIGPKYLAK